MNEEAERDAKLYMELAKQAQARFDSRRNVEWKVTVALWTLFGAASGAAINARIWAPDLVQAIALSLVAVAIVVLYGTYWLTYLAREFRRDQRTSYFWESGVQMLLGRRLCRNLDPGYGYTPPGRVHTEAEWIRMEDCPITDMVCGGAVRGGLHRSQWSQFCITALFALLFVVLIWGKWYGALPKEQKQLTPGLTGAIVSAP